MDPLTKLLCFLQDWHDAVMGCEKAALDGLAAGDNALYNARMREKAERMERLQASAAPLLEGLPADLVLDIQPQLKRFSNSARMGLHVNSPFYWSALLWNDDAKPGDKDNLQIFIDSLRSRTAG